MHALSALLVKKSVPPASKLRISSVVVDCTQARAGVVIHCLTGAKRTVKHRHSSQFESKGLYQETLHKILPSQTCIILSEAAKCLSPKSDTVCASVHLKTCFCRSQSMLPSVSKQTSFQHQSMPLSVSRRFSNSGLSNGRTEKRNIVCIALLCPFGSSCKKSEAASSSVHFGDDRGWSVWRGKSLLSLLTADTGGAAIRKLLLPSQAAWSSRPGSLHQADLKVLAAASATAWSLDQVLHPPTLAAPQGIRSSVWLVFQI